MTVIDTAPVVDLLLGVGAAEQVQALISNEGELAAPDLLVFETLAVLRRHTLRGALDPERAGDALEDLGELPIELFPSLGLRARAWSLRENFTSADGLFAALAERLDEPLATTDSALASEIVKHTGINVLALAGSH